MKKRKDTIFYSATDLADYQRCLYHIVNDIKNFEEPLARKEITEMGTAYIKKGNDLEIKYINNLIADGNNVLDIKNNPETNKTELTSKSMEEGVDYIYQPHLKFKNWIGQPDIIKKIKGKSKLGDYYYIPIDIKLSSEPKTKNITQILVYSFLLSKEQDFMPDHFLIINGQEFIKNKFFVKDFIESFNNQRVFAYQNVGGHYFEYKFSKYIEGQHNVADIIPTQEIVFGLIN